MQHKLNTVKYEQSVLDDGNYLYQFSDGTSVLQYINKGAVDFKQVSGTELEDLKGRIQGKISAGDVLKLGAAGIGCGLGVLTAPTGVGALVAAGTCGVVGGLTVKNVIESDATVQDGVVDVVLTGAFLGAGNLVGGLAKNAAGLLKNVPGVNQAGNLVKNLPGVSQVGNLVKNIPGASQLTNLAQNAGNLVSGSGSLIRENGAPETIAQLGNKLPTLVTWDGDVMQVTPPIAASLVDQSADRWPDFYTLKVEDYSHPYFPNFYLSGRVVVQRNGVILYEYFDAAGLYRVQDGLYMSTLRPINLDFPLGQPDELEFNPCLQEFKGMYPTTGHINQVGRFTGYGTTQNYHSKVTFYLYEREDGGGFLSESKPHPNMEPFIEQVGSVGVSYD